MGIFVSILLARGGFTNAGDAVQQRLVVKRLDQICLANGGGMDRWIIIGAVLAIFACLGVGGWYFQRGVQHPATICSNPDARCGDDRHL